jgi:phage repressor protein C with HTH and peptisase S24 domain
VSHEALNRLRERIAEAIGGRSGALAFERATDGRFSRKTLQRWIDGETWPDFAEIVDLAESSGKPLEFFLPPNLPDPSAETVKIPVLDVQAAAGAGRAADVVRAVRDLHFPVEFLKKIAAPDAQLSCLRAAGDSMAPTILDGALLLVDERQRKPHPFRAPARKGPRERQKQDEIFIFIQSGDLRLKRLRDVGDGLIAILSDNHTGYPIEIVKPGRDGALAIIGKVIWWDNRL